jgi:plastocyanin
VSGRRPLIAVIVAAVVTVGAAAFAVGRGVASDSGSSSSNTTVAAANAPQGPTTPVAIKDFAFSPETVTVKVGDAITWTNGDGFAHSVKSADGSFVSKDIEQGQSYSATFATAGTARADHGQRKDHDDSIGHLSTPGFRRRRHGTSAQSH